MSEFVPDGWKITRQGDAAKFINGRAYKLTEWEKEGTPVIRLQNLTGRGNEFYYSKLDLPDHQYCKSGDLLYMWSATLGPKFWKGPKAIFHYHIWKMEPLLDFDPRFSFWTLRYLTEEAIGSSRGVAGMLHITKGMMEAFTVQIPSPEAQRKISSQLDKLEECRRSLIAESQSQINRLQSLKSSLLDAAFKGKL